MVAEGAIKQAQTFLDIGANIRASDTEGNTVLHLVVVSLSCSPDLLAWLVGKGADVNAVCGTTKETLIFNSSEAGGAWSGGAE